jgi:nicotinamidase-related amidase
MDATVLLVMDVQRGIVERFSDDTGYLPRLAGAVTAARAAGIPVIYVTIGFTDGDPATEIHPAVAPGDGDLIVTKRRVSAFTGSDLDVLLRGLGAGTLVLAGIATSGVVLSTLRQAADLDYRLVVLADGCLDADPEVHQVLTGKVFPRQADVVTVAEWTAQLPPPAG